MCAGAGTPASSRLSVNSSNHSGRSRKRSSEFRLWDFEGCHQFSGAIPSLRSFTGHEERDESCGGDVEDETLP